jgi:hypothetical protein
MSLIPQIMSMGSHGGMTLTGETRRTLRKTFPSATLSTTNSTWTNAGLRSEKPSHGTALF